MKKQAKIIIHASAVLQPIKHSSSEVSQGNGKNCEVISVLHLIFFKHSSFLRQNAFEILQHRVISK